MKFEEGAQKFHTDLVSLSRSGQYGISEVDPQTSFRRKPVVAAGNIDCFLTPQNLGREIKCNFSHENYSRELHEENVTSYDYYTKKRHHIVFL